MPSKKSCLEWSFDSVKYMYANVCAVWAVGLDFEGGVHESRLDCGELERWWIMKFSGLRDLL